MNILLISGARGAPDIKGNAYETNGILTFWGRSNPVTRGELIASELYSQRFVWEYIYVWDIWGVYSEALWQDSDKFTNK